jgi:hypothetical protein
VSIYAFDLDRNQIFRGLIMKNLQQEATTIKIAIYKSWQQWLAASGFIVLTLLSPFVSAENSVIGKVVYVDGKVILQESLTVQGSSMFGGQRTLTAGDEISIHDMLKTLEGSTLKVSFIDGAEITLRPGTDIFIEKYSQKEAEIEIIKGGIRVVTGTVAKWNPELYKVVTPEGVVTARQEGSDFSVRICAKDCDEENKKMAGPMMKTDLPVIAKVVAIQGEVNVGKKFNRRLGLGYPVYSTEHIISSKNSFAQLQFIDGSSVTVQAESAFDITDYKYNETGKKDKSVFKLIEGGLHFVSGSMAKNNPEAFSLDTTVATVGVNGTDFTVNCAGSCSSGGIVSHVNEGSISQRNESGSHVLESGSYGAISGQSSSPVVTTTAPVTFANNIAPSPSTARVNTASLFAAGGATVEPGTHVSVKEGQVDVAGSAGGPVGVGANLSVAVSGSGNVTSPGSVSNFQMMDPVFTVPPTAAIAPVATKNTIVIGGPSGIGVNAATGSTAITTIVIQEQTIATPYNYR